MTTNKSRQLLEKDRLDSISKTCNNFKPSFWATKHIPNEQFDSKVEVIISELKTDIKWLKVLLIAIAAMVVKNTLFN